MVINEGTDNRDTISSIWNMISTTMVFGLSSILLVRKYVLESMKQEVDKEKILYEFLFPFFPDPHDDCFRHENVIDDSDPPNTPPDLEEPKGNYKLLNQIFESIPCEIPKIFKPKY